MKKTRTTEECKKCSRKTLKIFFLAHMEILSSFPTPESIFQGEENKDFPIITSYAKLQELMKELITASRMKKIKT